MLITLSRQMGSFGDTIAARVAAALDLALVDRTYIARLAASSGLPKAVLQQLTYEGQRSLAAEILDSMQGLPAAMARGPSFASSPSGMLAPLVSPLSIDLQEGMRTLAEIIRNVAAQGQVLVLGQGGQVLLHDMPDSCHVQIVAPVELRVRRVAERRQTVEAEARRQVRQNDRARADYLARYLGVNWLDPVLYDLVISTERASVDSAVSLIISASQALTSPKVG